MSNATIDTPAVTGTVLKVPAFAKWSKDLTAAMRTGNHAQFTVGDLWAAGRDAYSDREEVTALLAKFDYSTGTLNNYASIACRFPAELRRDGLKFNVFVVLSPLAERDDIAAILDAAEADHWSIPTARMVNKALKAGESLESVRDGLKALESGSESDASDGGDAESDGDQGTPSTEVAVVLTADDVIAAFMKLPPAEMAKVIAVFTGSATE